MFPRKAIRRVGIERGAFGSRQLGGKVRRRAGVLALARVPSMRLMVLFWRSCTPMPVPLSA